MKELIEKSGLSIKEFAEKYEIPYNTVRQWYNGERKMPRYLKNLIEDNLFKKNWLELLSDRPIFEEIPKKQPKYVYCFINENEETPLRLRRFTNNEDVLKCEDAFWAKRYAEEWKKCDVYRYELKNETKIH